MKLLKTETGFRIEEGGRSLELGQRDMKKVRARVAGLQAMNPQISHDDAYRRTLTEILNEGGPK